MNEILDDRRREMKPEKHHNLYVTDRQSITVHGVTDVLSFDEAGVFLVTICGQLHLEGSDLHITVLNTEDGIVEVTGRLNGLLYYDDAQPFDDGRGDRRKGKRGLFGRFSS